ncbi:MAG: metallophosphoesterase [Phycisphaerales bacterium]|nr:metallophosphoesterase [Phycisphaerales bacterium]
MDWEQIESRLCWVESWSVFGIDRLRIVVIEYQHILGLISDPHGDAARTRSAIELLKAKGATAFIFLGDAETESVLDQFTGLKTWVVFGNTDEVGPLGDHARLLGLQVVHPLGTLQINGKSVAFTHGHLDQCVADAFASGADYLLHGHTHRRRDDRIGNTRVINPGALNRASHFHAAILDVFSDELLSMEIV